MALREKLLGTKDKIKRDPAVIPDEFQDPEICGQLFLRSLSGEEYYNYQLEVEKHRNKKGKVDSGQPIIWKLLELICEDKEKIPVFKAGDLEQIKLMPKELIEALYEQGALLCKLIKPKPEPDVLEILGLCQLVSEASDEELMQNPSFPLFARRLVQFILEMLDSSTNETPDDEESGELDAGEGDEGSTSKNEEGATGEHLS